MSIRVKGLPLAPSLGGVADSTAAILKGALSPKSKPQAWGRTLSRTYRGWSCWQPRQAIRSSDPHWSLVSPARWLLPTQAALGPAGSSPGSLFSVFLGRPRVALAGATVSSGEKTKDPTGPP